MASNRPIIQDLHYRQASITLTTTYPAVSHVDVDRRPKPSRHAPYYIPNQSAQSSRNIPDPRTHMTPAVSHRLVGRTPGTTGHQLQSPADLSCPPLQNAMSAIDSRNSHMTGVGMPLQGSTIYTPPWYSNPPGISHTTVADRMRSPCMSIQPLSQYSHLVTPQTTYNSEQHWDSSQAGTSSGQEQYSTRRPLEPASSSCPDLTVEVLAMLQRAVSSYGDAGFWARYRRDHPVDLAGSNPALALESLLQGDLNSKPLDGSPTDLLSSLERLRPHFFEPSNDHESCETAPPQHDHGVTFPDATGSISKRPMPPPSSGFGTVSDSGPSRIHLPHIYTEGHRVSSTHLVLQSGQKHPRPMGYKKCSLCTQHTRSCDMKPDCQIKYGACTLLGANCHDTRDDPRAAQTRTEDADWGSQQRYLESILVEEDTGNGLAA